MNTNAAALADMVLSAQERNWKHEMELKET